MQPVLQGAAWASTVDGLRAAPRSARVPLGPRRLLGHGGSLAPYLLRRRGAHLLPCDLRLVPLVAGRLLLLALYAPLRRGRVAPRGPGHGALLHDLRLFWLLPCVLRRWALTAMRPFLYA